MTAPRSSSSGTAEAWAVLYLHDWGAPVDGQEHKWEPGKNVFPEIHNVYTTWQEAESVRARMSNPGAYWVRKVHLPAAPSPQAQACEPLDATELAFLEDNVATLAHHLGRPGARLSVTHDGPGLVVDAGEVLKEVSRRLGAAQAAPEPAMWVCLVTPKGEHEEPHIRAWTTRADRAQRFQELEGLDMQPFYAALPSPPAPLPAGETIAWLLTWPDGEVSFYREPPPHIYGVTIVPLYAAPQPVDPAYTAKDRPHEAPEWLWYGEVDGNSVVSFGRWPRFGAKWRYKWADIQPTEHDFPRARTAQQDRKAFERVVARLNYDGSETDSLTVGEIRRALPLPSTEGK